MTRQAGLRYTRRMSEEAKRQGEVRLDRSGHVAVIVIDRPERRNALSQTMWTGLDRIVGDLERSLPRAVILTGGGDKAFCAGMDVNPDNPDLSGLLAAMQDRDPAPAREMLERLRRITRCGFLGKRSSTLSPL